MGKKPASVDAEKDAKMSVLEELRDLAMKAMGEKLEPKEEGMSEVRVAAKDPESLHEGLEMASALLPEKEDELRSDSSLVSEPEMEMGDDMDLEEIESMIRELEVKRREKLMKA